MNRKEIEHKVGGLEERIEQTVRRLERTDDAVATLLGLFKGAVITLGKALDVFMASRGVSKDADMRQSVVRLIDKVRATIPAIPEDE